MQVLIVDDNVTNGLLLQRVVGRIENCIAHSFTDPVEALAKAAEVVFDIALVDYLGGLAEGRLVRGDNPVLMTMELVLEVLGEGAGA